MSKPTFRNEDQARGSFLTGICSISKEGASGSGANVDVILGVAECSVLEACGCTVSVIIEPASSLIDPESLTAIMMS